MMKWDTLQQLIRIVGYAGGSYWFGDAVANGDMFNAALGGLVNVAAFVWWMVNESNKA